SDLRRPEQFDGLDRWRRARCSAAGREGHGELRQSARGRYAGNPAGAEAGGHRLEGSAEPRRDPEDAQAARQPAELRRSEEFGAAAADGAERARQAAEVRPRHAQALRPLERSAVSEWIGSRAAAVSVARRLLLPRPQQREEEGRRQLAPATSNY